MRVGSLFSGGGLGDYGLELAGMEIVFQVEIDEYCQKILNLRWPNVPKWRDIKDVKGSELPKIDLLSGGFPCQDVSVIGRKEGISGYRSGLWKEFYRLICELRPKYILVENVTGLLSGGMDTVLGDLASGGYDAWWDCIPASAFGAPHKRDRVWILAYPQGQSGFQADKKTLPQRGGGSARRDAVWLRWREMAQADWEIHESYVDGSIDGTPSRVDRCRITGNGQVVQVVQWIGERIMEFEKKKA